MKKCEPKNGGVKSISIIPIEINLYLYDKSDLRKDLSVKRKYGKFKREQKTDFYTAFKQLEEILKNK